MPVYQPLGSAYRVRCCPKRVRCNRTEMSAKAASITIRGQAQSRQPRVAECQKRGLLVGTALDGLR